MTDTDHAVTRLCRACGMCCNGVLFHNVRLQPADSPKSLAALGLRLKHKNGVPCFLQPCPAWRAQGCQIYEERPTRCRVFECRQIALLRDAQTTEVGVLEKIETVKRKVTEVSNLLEECGSRNAQRPLLKRCEMMLSNLPDSELHQNPKLECLRSHSAVLDRLLELDFRVGV